VSDRDYKQVCNFRERKWGRGHK